MQDILDIQQDGGVLRLTMNRPERLNTMNEPLIAALLNYFTALAARPEVRVVVLRGEGRAFCAGLDLSSMGQADRWGEGGLAERTHGNANRAQQVARDGLATA